MLLPITWLTFRSQNIQFYSEISVISHCAINFWTKKSHYSRTHYTDIMLSRQFPLYLKRMRFLWSLFSNISCLLNHQKYSTCFVLSSPSLKFKIKWWTKSSGFFLLDLNSWCQADLGQNFFRKNYFPKLEQFDLLISKLISLSPNQNAQIWETSFLRNQLTGDSALDIKLSGPWY